MRAIIFLSMVLLLAPVTFAETFVVNTFEDVVDANPGDGVCASALETTTCSLRAAVQEANVLEGSDRIELPEGTFTLTLTGNSENKSLTGDLDILDNVVIIGSGDMTVVDGNRTDRLFDIQQGVVTLMDFSLKNGTFALRPGGGALINRNGEVLIERVTIQNNIGGVGGGISNLGIMTVRNSNIFSNNVGTSNGGGIWNSGKLLVERTRLNANFSGQGGGIFNRDGDVTVNESFFMQNSVRGVGGSMLNTAGGTLEVNGSTLADNVSDDAGGIHNFGKLTVNNTTISGNLVRFRGGAIINLNGEALIQNSTIFNNTGSAGAGGILSMGNTRVVNSIVAGNKVNGNQISVDCEGSFISQGYNLIGNNASCIGFGSNGDLVGTSIQPIDPRLGQLSNNGGFTLTHALLSNSPAKDSGNRCGAIDQRGSRRPQGSACDIGAFEA